MPKNYKSFKTHHWLHWDGSYTLAGTCNGSHAVTPPTDEPLFAYTPLLKLTGVHGPTRTADPIVIGRNVSVRVLQCIETVKIATHDVKVPVQIKNGQRVRAMMLRVYDASDRLRYQEVIKGKPAEKLPQLTKTELNTVLTEETGSESESESSSSSSSGSGLDAISVKANAKGGLDPKTSAHSGASPYRFEVWVSRKADAFDAVDATTDIKTLVKYMETVHNEYTPTRQDWLDKEEAYAVKKKKRGKFSKLVNLYSDYQTKQRELRDLNNRLDAKLTRQQRRDRAGRFDPRKINVLGGSPRFRVVLNKTQTSDTVDQWPADNPTGYTLRVDQLFAAIDKAQDYLNLSEFDPDALKLMMCGEWYFRNPKSVKCLSHKDLKAIVDSIKAKSTGAKYANWLIIPGTVYYGLGYQQAAMGGVNLATDIQTYVGQALEGGTAPRDHAGGSDVFYVANLCPVIHNGNVVHYCIKENQNDALNPDEKWAMSELSAVQRTTARRPRVFTWKTLNFGLDICMDHDVGVGMREYINQARGGRNGVDIQLVTSFGVMLTEKSVFARDGGYLIQNDSSGPGTHCMRVCVNRGTNGTPDTPRAPGTTPATGEDPNLLIASWNAWKAFEPHLAYVNDRAVVPITQIYTIESNLGKALKDGKTGNELTDLRQQLQQKEQELEIQTVKADILGWPEWGTVDVTFAGYDANKRQDLKDTFAKVQHGHQNKLGHDPEALPSGLYEGTNTHWYMLVNKIFSLGRGFKEILDRACAGLVKATNKAGTEKHFQDPSCTGDVTIYTSIIDFDGEPPTVEERDAAKKI